MSPEALEAFQKFTQSKGLPLEDILLPAQTGERAALPTFPSPRLQLPSHCVPCVFLCPSDPPGSLYPLGGGACQHCAVSQGPQVALALGFRSPSCGWDGVTSRLGFSWFPQKAVSLRVIRVSDPCSQQDS